MAPAGFSIQSYAEPVDTLTEICAAISVNPERRFTIYHCCDPQPPHDDFGPADFGLYLREVPYETFRRACQALEERSPLHGLWTLLDFFAPYWFADGEARGAARSTTAPFARTVPFLSGGRHCSSGMRAPTTGYGVRAMGGPIRCRKPAWTSTA